MAKKILITTESLIMGGVEKALLSLIEFLKKYDVEIDLYVLEKGLLYDDFKKITKVNMIPINVPKNKIMYRIFKNLLCHSLYKKYQKNKQKSYDIAIAYYGINNYADMYAASSKADKKFIWVHNNFEELSQNSKYPPIMKIRNKIIKKKFNYFDHIIAVSNAARDGFIHTFKDFHSKIVVINNIFDVNKLKTKETITLSGNQKIMFVGRLTKSKGVDILILEFKKVLEQIKNVKLYIIGDGEEKENLMQLVKDNNLASQVEFLGSINNPFPYMKAADLIVSASKSEALSVNLMEALALKKYFISNVNEGAKYIFNVINNKNENNGMICENNNLHKYIIKYLKNQNQYHQEFNINEFNKTIENLLTRYLEL